MGFKKSLRDDMRIRRRAMTAAEKSAADATICENLAARDDVAERIAAGSPVAVYLASREEIDIDRFVMHLIGRGADVVAPRWNGVAYELARLKGLGGTSLRRGPMGIREPAEAEIVSPGAVRVWVVPGLAFDKNGARLGYGGGWYDRLLSAAPHGAAMIGIAYRFQIVDAVHSEPHDIPMTDIVSD